MLPVMLKPVNWMRGEPLVTAPYGPPCAIQWFDQWVGFSLVHM